MSNTDEVRELITAWVTAIQNRDIEGVMARHDPNIVQFDVPPPYDGLRGIDQYRDSWPMFFEWLDQGAILELVELEVVAGVDVAFGYALLRCGAPADLAANPDNRLRMTAGLHKVDGTWIVLHEHASFCMA
jgi:ketosteroid isomerase-like protein